MKNILKLIGIIALVAVIAFSMAACSDDDGDNGYWLISKYTSYPVTEGAGSFAETNYIWIAYRYSNEKNYEEEYNTIDSTTGSLVYHHYTRNGQTSESITQTDAGTSSTTTLYDAESGLTLKYTSNSSENTYVISYNITPLGDSDGAKTYRYKMNSYINNGTSIDISTQGYDEYKIQNGKTLEVKTFTAAGVLSSTVKYTYTDDTTQTSSYDASNVLVYTSTTTKSDIKVIRDKLPRFRLYRYNYSSPSYSSSNSYQTAEVLSDSDSALLIRVKTFSNNVLSAQTDSLYEKIKPNGSGSGSKNPSGNNGGNGGNNSPDNGGVKSNSDFDYEVYGNSITITGYKGKGGNVTIPAQINGKPVTNIWCDAFSGCTSLTSVTIPDSVTSIERGAFSGCTGLTGTLTIPNSVKYLSGFDGCTSLTSVKIPNSVTSIEYSAFYGCTSLASVTIPNSVTSIGDSAFAGCTSLTSVTISNSVTSIGNYAFDGCTSLTSVTIPDSVTSIMWFAFRDCTSLTSVTIPNSVTSIELGTFRDCTSLTSVTIPNSVTSIGGGAFGSCTSLTSVKIPNSVTSIGGGAFYSCTSLTSVTIPNSVTSIGDSAFAGCTSLTSVTFQGTITANNFGSGSAYYGDLDYKYLNGGGIGTYTTTAPVNWDSKWTKQ